MGKEAFMKNKTKMNVLYKIAFILMLVCVVLLFLAGFLGYLISPDYALVLGGLGVALAFVAIVLASLSSPKKEELLQAEENFEEQSVDN